MKSIKKGFTIIEVLSVIIIIAMASVVSIPKIDDVMEQPKNLKVMTDLKAYEFAILELHYAKEPITAGSISNIVDSELEFELNESKGENPYGNKYKIKQNGPDDVTIESLKSGSRIIGVIQSLHAYKSGTKMIIDYENIDESLSSEIIVDRTASTPPPADINSYYTFTADALTGGLKVGLQSSFKDAIINNQEFIDWKPGQPLPNPGVSYNNSSITSYEEMFAEMTASEIDVSNFQTESVVSTKGMFMRCTSKIIGIENWRLNNLKSSDYMFFRYDESNTKILLIGKFPGTGGENSVVGMFRESNVKSVDLTKFEMSNIDNITYMFSYFNADKLSLGKINNLKLTSLERFLPYANIQELNIDTMDLPNVRNLDIAFILDKEEVDLTNMNLNTSLAWTVSNTFSSESTYYLNNMATLNKFRAITGLCENSTLTLKPVNVENYYKYTLVGGGYAVSLTDGFKSALTGGKSYEKWTYGTPLPNPGKIYNNKPVISYNGTFMGLKITNLDLSLWDMNNVKDTTAMFKDAEIANLKMSYWKSTKAPMLSISQMFQNAKIANVPSIGNMTIDGYTSAVDVFTGSTMTQLKVHAAMLSNWKNYKTATTEVILA